MDNANRIRVLVSIAHPKLLKIFQISVMIPINVLIKGGNARKIYFFAIISYFGLLKEKLPTQ